MAGRAARSGAAQRAQVAIENFKDGLLELVARLAGEVVIVFDSVFSKFSAIWGPLVFALVSNATGSGRPAILSVVAFFVIGFVLLARVDIEAAKASREEWVFENA